MAAGSPISKHAASPVRAICGSLPSARTASCGNPL